MSFSCLLPAKRRISGRSALGISGSAGATAMILMPARMSQGGTQLAATATGLSRRSASRTVARGATMATRTSQGSMTTSAFLRSCSMSAATRGVRFGGDRYMAFPVTS